MTGASLWLFVGPFPFFQSVFIHHALFFLHVYAKSEHHGVWMNYDIFVLATVPPHLGVQQVKLSVVVSVKIECFRPNSCPKLQMFWKIKVSHHRL